MVEPHNIKKCNSHKKYMNIYGEVIYLTLMKHDNILGVTLRKNSDILIHCILYVGIFLLNAISFKLDLVGTAPFSIIACFLVLLIYLKSGHIIEENLIAIQPLGYQLNTKYILGQKSTFIPVERVQTIFINEVIFKQKIIYILTILSKGSNGDMLIPLFMGAKPRIKCLEFILRELLSNKG